MHKHFRIFVGAAAVFVSSVFFALLPKDAFAGMTVECGKDGFGWGSCQDFEFSGDGGVPSNSNSDDNIRITITGDSAWRITQSGADWINFSESEGSLSNGSKSITFSAVANDYLGVDRSGTLTFTEIRTGQTQTISVSQEGGRCGSAGATCLVDNNNKKIPNGSEIKLPASGGSTSMRVFSDWTSTIDPSVPITIWSNNSGDSTCPGITTSGQRIIATKNDSGATRECAIRVGDVAGATMMFPVIQESTKKSDGSENEEADEGTTNPTNPGSSGGESGSSGAVDSECQLGKFGWAVCPILSALDEILGGVYGWVEENFLQVKVEFYETDSNTYKAWNTFRNIANVLFVIFFLIVILSQVTSVGISNYGVKRMLPEIIVAAILINVSYYIAQAAVDISNIVGYQIQSLLESIIAEGGDTSGGGGDGGVGLIATLGVILGATAATSLVATVLAGGLGAVVAGLVLFLLSALIAILVLFLLLVARQVGVIILVVLAPLAFAARILPNTAGMFKAWWKAFSALLLVYPACGLVIGAGKLAGKIIAGGSTDNLIILAGMIAVIAPYFAVISIIKGSLNGLGKLGGMITGKVTGAGAGLNKLGRTGVGLAQKRYDQSAGRQARLATAKLKAEQKNAIRTAEGKGVLGKLRDAEIEASQTKDAATLAANGQYDDNGLRSKGLAFGSAEWKEARKNEKFMQISAKRAEEIGVDPKTGIATRPAASAGEKQMQAMAKTARNQADAKYAKTAAEGFENRSASSIYDEVYDGSAFNANVDQITAEQSIKQMEDKGEWAKSASLQDAYMAKWGSGTGDVAARGRGRLGQILQSKDSKEQSFARNAYGKALAEKDFQGTFNDFMRDRSSTGNGIGKAIATGKYRNAYGSMHGEAINELARHDADGSLRKSIAQQMNLQSVGQMGDNNMDAFLTNADGSKLDGSDLFRHVAQDYAAAGDNAATLGYSDKMRKTIGVVAPVKTGMPPTPPPPPTPTPPPPPPTPSPNPSTP